jgi:hypothetical protein
VYSSVAGEGDLLLSFLVRSLDFERGDGERRLLVFAAARRVLTAGAGMCRCRDVFATCDSGRRERMAGCVDGLVVDDRSAAAGLFSFEFVVDGFGRTAAAQLSSVVRLARSAASWSWTGW